MKLYIDADACPVKEEALRVAARYQIPVFIVSNGGMRPSREPLVTNITVPTTPDAADDWIAERLQPDDVVVTQDIPLAARALDVGASALGPSGKVFTEQTIGMALAMRELNQQIREAHNSQTRHSPFTTRDRSIFLQALDQIIASKRKTAQGLR